MGEQRDPGGRGAGREDGEPLGRFARRVFVAVGITVLTVGTVLLIGYAAEVFLLIFAGILLSLFFRALADRVAGLTRLPARASLGGVVLTLGGLFFLAGWFLGPHLVAQVADLTRSLPESLARAHAALQSQPWGEWLLGRVPNDGEVAATTRAALAEGYDVFSTSLGWAVNVAVVFFLGLFFAVEPDRYVAGVVWLVPPTRRSRAREVLSEMGKALRNWLVGQGLAMAEVTLLTWLGLWLLGIPAPLALALLVGLASFVPNIGPIIASVPILLLAWTVSPWHVLYAALLQVGIGIFDGYIFTPLVQQEAVGIPAAVVISAQVLMGVLLGGLGVLLAMPLVVVATVLVRELYVKDTLGEPGKG